MGDIHRKQSSLLFLCDQEGYTCLSLEQSTLLLQQPSYSQALQLFAKSYRCPKLHQHQVMKSTFQILPRWHDLDLCQVYLLSG